MAPFDPAALQPGNADAAGIPAASLIVMADGSGGEPALLFGVRAPALRFAPNAVVFPGGRVDEQDHRMAAALPHALDPDDAAARIAAIRETIEEAGLVPNAVVGAEPGAVRTLLKAGRGLATALAEAGGTLDLTALVPFARWDPRFAKGRSFDTRFYLARGSRAAPLRADGEETVAVFWDSARAMLDAIACGNREAIFPTILNLHRLAQFGSFAEAAAAAPASATTIVTPWIEEEQGRRMLCIAPGLGYPVTRLALDGLRRG